MFNLLLLRTEGSTERAAEGKEHKHQKFDGVLDVFRNSFISSMSLVWMYLEIHSYLLCSYENTNDMVEDKVA